MSRRGGGQFFQPIDNTPVTSQKETEIIACMVWAFLFIQNIAVNKSNGTRSISSHADIFMCRSPSLLQVRGSGASNCLHRNIFYLNDSTAAASNQCFHAFAKYFCIFVNSVKPMTIILYSKDCQTFCAGLFFNLRHVRYVRML